MSLEVCEHFYSKYYFKERKKSAMLNGCHCPQIYANENFPTLKLYTMSDYDHSYAWPQTKHLIPSKHRFYSSSNFCRLAYNSFYIL